MSYISHSKLLKFNLILNFAIPALLLNCVGIVILNLVNLSGVTISAASWLEAFKDFSILGGSFFLVSYIPKMGYKKSMIIGIVLGITACVLMAISPSFLMARIFFILVGVGFGLIKVAVYSSVGLITNDDSEHASFISILEGVFMGAVLGGFWLFGFFMHHGVWVRVFWLLAGIGVIGLILAVISPMHESEIIDASEKLSLKDSYREMFGLLLHVAIWIFLFLTFSYLFIEQGIINWLPTFNNHVLHIASAQSVEIASLLSGGIAIGRLVFGVAMKKIHWSKVLMFCVICSIIVLLITVYFAAHMQQQKTIMDITNWLDFPVAAYLLPLVGFLVGPIYPTICSSILSAQPKRLHSAMTVWIVVISALGGTVGAKVMGTLFSHYGGLIAVSILFVPLVVLLIFIMPYYFLLCKK